MGFVSENTYEEVQACRGDLLHLLEDLEPLLGAGDRQIESWKSALKGLENAGEKITRVAIVGAVKSGKSTFCNYFLGEDLLKRGAGVITSIVTRLRFGSHLEAELVLKGLPQISEEIGDALEYLDPAGEFVESEAVRLDRPEDRKRLEAFLESLTGRVGQGEEFVKQVSLLKAYLEGYEQVASLLKQEEAVLNLSGEEVPAHRDLVGKESGAVFLKEAVLTIPSSRLPAGVEIGDCQGSDSPNPAHMAAVLEYLLDAHFVVYLISSRTGIRAADVQLVQTLQTLQLSNQLFFVLNLDLGEHEDRASVVHQIERTETDLRQLGLRPRIYAFSALYHLLQEVPRENLSKKDLIRTALWEEEDDLVRFSGEECARFEKDFRELLSEERLGLTIQREVAVLARTIDGIEDSLTLRKAWLSRGGEEAEGVFADLKERQRAIRDTVELVRNALAGEQTRQEAEIKTAVDRFLDTGIGPPVTALLSFIQEFSDNTGPPEEQGGTLKSLARFYHRLSGELLACIQNDFNLRIVKFAKQKESEIRERYVSQMASYLTLLQQLFENYIRETERISRVSVSRKPEPLVLNPQSRLKPLLFKASFHFRVRAKAEVLFGLGVGKTVEGVKRLAQKVFGRGEEEDTDALRTFRKGEEIIRNCIKEELLEQVADYKENLKFGFFLKTSRSVSEEIFRQIREYIENNLVDLSRLNQLVEGEESRKEAERRRIDDVLARLHEFRRRLDSVPYPRGGTASRFPSVS